MDRLVDKIGYNFKKYISSVVLIYILLSIVLFAGLSFLEKNYLLFVFIFISSFFVMTSLVMFLVRMSVTLKDKIKEVHKYDYQNTESLMYILSMIKIKSPLPPSRSWAVAPDLVSIIFRRILDRKPKNIVELGSGISTQFICHLIKDHELNSKLYSIDHSRDFLNLTIRNLQVSDLDNYAETLYCPLTKHTINQKNWNWYDIDFENLPKIDLLIVDGPVAAESKYARYPALPKFSDKLNDNAMIILDDYHRQDENEIVQRWLKEIDGLKLTEEADTEKGCAVLTFSPGS